MKHRNAFVIIQVTDSTNLLILCFFKCVILPPKKVKYNKKWLTFRHVLVT